MLPGSIGDQVDSGHGPHNLLDDPLPSVAPSKSTPQLGVWASPLAIDEDSGETFGFQGKRTQERFKRAVKYYMHHFIGPMPVEDFLDTFMNRQAVLKKYDQDPMPPSKDAFANVPEKAEKEVEIYAPLIKSLNLYIDPETKLQRSRCPGFRFLDTSTRSDSTHGKLGAVKPDVCCYAEPHVELVQEALTEEAKSQDQGATVMGYAALFIEVKRNVSFDPFKDPPSGADRSWWKFCLNLDGVTSGKQEEVQECFGQNTTYAAEILARQHRQFLYSISLCGSAARVIRWDRAGAVCTNVFDIRKYPEYLCEFLWCFAAASDMERGYDLNVEMAYPYEHFLFRSVILHHLVWQAPIVHDTPDAIGAVWDRMESVHFLEGHVTAIRLPVSNSGAVQRFLVSRPFVYPLATFGRGTRIYWAVDATAPHDRPLVVLLKDTWREDPPCSKGLEGDVIQHLTDLKVGNVPQVRSYGDVPQRDEVVTHYPDRFHVAIQNLGYYQSTRTQDFLGSPWVCGARLPDHLAHIRIRKHTHHRLVFDAAGHTLAQFCGTQELLAAGLDVLKTLNGASKGAWTVHRALSPSSIILYRPPEVRDSRRLGYLIDWDQAWDEREDLPTKNNPFSPPWQFVCSALALSISPIPRYTTEHDMEALLYVVLYLAILCLAPSSTSKKGAAAAQAIKLFEGQHIDGGQPNSTAKLLNQTDRRFTEHLEWTNPHMKLWMDKMLDALRPLSHSTTGESQWTYTNVKILWENVLKDIPFEEDRMESLASLNGREADAPRALEAQPNCPTMSNPGSLGAKQDLDFLYRGKTEPDGTSFVERMNIGLAIRTLPQGRVPGTRGDKASTTAYPKLYKLDTGRSVIEESFTRRGIPEAATNAKAGPSRLPGGHIDVTDPDTTTSNDASGDPPLDVSIPTTSHTKSTKGKRKAPADP